MTEMELQTLPCHFATRRHAAPRGATQCTALLFTQIHVYTCQCTLKPRGEVIMSTFKSTNYRAFLLVPVFAAFAVHAQAADGFADTQGQVRSVLEGARSVTSANSP